MTHKYALRICRVYEPRGPEDGTRVLVDRLWPRGIKKDDARIDRWLPEVAPSTELRRWFHEHPQHWEEFQQRYWTELEARPDVWRGILDLLERGPVTLVYARRDTQRNNAVALRAFLLQKLKRASGRRGK